MKLNNNVVAFTGGGTAGHIYPGLAVADELKSISKAENKNISIFWIGSNVGMDKNIVEKTIGLDGKPIADCFYGIPSGKLRRYLSIKNFTDLFRIVAGYFKARKILRKTKPAILFSKGGFVSVPPCLAAKHLKIPVYTHECDFTLGLANKINFKSAKTMFVSYEETKNRLSSLDQKRVVVTGNPVRPVFYNAKSENGFKFLNIEKTIKPILLVLGGSSGAKQINELVWANLDFLTKNFIVVHQTGLINNNEEQEKQFLSQYGQDYKPYAFIYEQMPDVLSCCDVILSRSGANSIWEAAVLEKPSLLIPLCGSGTRGDQVDNAKFFEEKNAALVLIGQDANSENLKKELTKFLNKDFRENMKNNIRKMVGSEKSVTIIAKYLYEQLEMNNR